LKGRYPTAAERPAFFKTAVSEDAKVAS
jgi:hypothetical protein